MTKMVQIQSSITIKVTPGLQNKDVTNPDAHVPDRLKINPEWPKYQVLITQGVGKYPAEICDWPSVQALAKDNILTIGAITDVDEAVLEEKEKIAMNSKPVEEMSDDEWNQLMNDRYKKQKNTI